MPIVVVRPVDVGPQDEAVVHLDRHVAVDPHAQPSRAGITGSSSVDGCSGPAYTVVVPP